MNIRKVNNGGGDGSAGGVSLAEPSPENENE